MNLEKEKIRLLKVIESYEAAESPDKCAGIKEELAKIRKNKSAAYDRMIAQTKAGSTVSAQNSRKAYDFCCKYEKQLEGIIDGYEHMKSGKGYFTKDGANRYRNYTAAGPERKEV